MAQDTTRRDLLTKGGGVAATASLVGLSGCIGMLGGSGGTVSVSSKRFPEQRILGYMAIEALRANSDLEVKDETGLGGSTTNFKAVNNGEVDLYWEYTGTAWMSFPPKHDDFFSDPNKLYQEVKKEFKEEHNLVFLDKAKYNSTYVIMANPKWAQKTGVKTMSGLAEYINNGNTDFTAVMSSQELEREDGWPGLVKHYGFEDSSEKINVKTVSPGLVYQVVGEGEAAVGFGINTSPKIAKFGIETLKDDKGFFPPYNPAPLVNGKSLENNPGLKEPLNSISPLLTTKPIRNLNKRVSIDGDSAQNVAKSFLQEKNVI